MAPKKLGTDSKTIKVQCPSGHEFARYRKPKAEWGERTHKLWLIEERLGRLSTEPPILIEGDDETTHVNIPETGTQIQCGGDANCQHVIGEIAVVKGTPAIELAREVMRRTKG